MKKWISENGQWKVIIIGKHPIIERTKDKYQWEGQKLDLQKSVGYRIWSGGRKTEIKIPKYVTEQAIKMIEEVQ